MIVADIDPARPDASASRSLDVSFSCESHTKLEPLATTVEIIGLNRDTRAMLKQQQDAAKTLAWEEYQKVLTGALEVTAEEQIFQVQQQLVFNGLQVVIEAGYQDDFAIIANAQTMPDGIKHDTSSVPRTTIRAQDGRYPWQNGWVQEEVAPGVTFLDFALVEQLSEGFLTGELTADQLSEASAGTILQRKSYAGYLNGRVLEGDASARVTEIAQTLGLRPFFDRGNRVWLDPNSVTLDEAVVLQLIGKPFGGIDKPTPGGLLSYTEEDRGFLSVHCLLNHRLTAGRQVRVFDEAGRPIGAGVFRVDYVKHTGTNFGPAFHSDAILRPTAIPAAQNV